jgi:tetratricopeptide (TPR) repeat protein
MNRYAILAVALATFPTLAATPRTDATTDHPIVAYTAASSFYIELGDLFSAQKRFDAARARYAAAATLARIEGTLPVEAVRRIANTYYFEGTYKEAEATLAKLADEAAQFGDWEAQIWAIADAAWLAQLAGDAASVGHHVELLESLLDFHALPGGRYKVRTRLLKDFAVFAPHLTSW